MTAAPAEPPERKRPPYFTTTVDVDISPSDLEDEGWVYVGNEDDSAGDVADERVIAVVVSWHDRHHTAPWRWCDDDLCVQLRPRWAP